MVIIENKVEKGYRESERVERGRWRKRDRKKDRPRYWNWELERDVERVNEAAKKIFY